MKHFCESNDWPGTTLTDNGKNIYSSVYFYVIELERIEALRGPRLRDSIQSNTIFEYFIELEGIKTRIALHL